MTSAAFQLGRGLPNQHCLCTTPRQVDLNSTKNHYAAVLALSALGNLPLSAASAQ